MGVAGGEDGQPESVTELRGFSVESRSKTRNEKEARVAARSKTIVISVPDRKRRDLSLTVLRSELKKVLVEAIHRDDEFVVITYRREAVAIMLSPRRYAALQRARR